MAITRFCIPIIIAFSFACGTNTDTPVSPFVFLVPVGAPQILSVVPTTSNFTDEFLTDINRFNLSPKPEFLVRYYVTNREAQFVGYNLYITSAIPSIAETLSGEYLENGVQPSFSHQPIEASTEKTRIVTRRIRNRIPPPGVVPFQKCQTFNFVLRAFMNTGIISNPSVSVTSCASTEPSICDIGSACNPTLCSVSNCGSQSSCAVGTVCNPCKSSLPGCICAEGTFPPGCYL